MLQFTKLIQISPVSIVFMCVCVFSLYTILNICQFMCLSSLQLILSRCITTGSLMFFFVAHLLSSNQFASSVIPGNHKLAVLNKDQKGGNISAQKDLKNLLNVLTTSSYSHICRIILLSKKKSLESYSHNYKNFIIIL